jgi:hypothetical protein
MQRHWDTLLEREQEGFVVVLEKTWEDVHPNDCFDDSAYDIADMCAKIDRGDLDWFVLRARVIAEGVELGSACCGGMLYENAKDSLSDVGEDLVLDAMVEAKDRLTYLAKQFTMLTIKSS